jgi:hypothetical protein
MSQSARYGLGKCQDFRIALQSRKPWLYFERTQTTFNHQNIQAHYDSIDKRLLNHPLRPLITPDTMVNVPKSRNTFCKGKVRNKNSRNMMS